MFILVGLGNPGKEYDNTRHNVGFMAVDEICYRYNFTNFSKKFDGLIAEGKIADEKVIALKPQTYMNLSGNSVHKLMSYYKIPPENIIVIHDDLDLALSKIKAKLGGGHGGHNGLKNIDSHIGKNYNRIRIGIGQPNQKTEVINHVLNKFSKAETEVIKKNIKAISDNIEYIIKDSVGVFLNKLGASLKPNHKKKKETKENPVKKTEVKKEEKTALGTMAEALKKALKK
jgi:PTH1 family peptidyl-tRNA hydrolase